CAGCRVADAASLGDRPYCWRMRVPNQTIAWMDGFRGPTSLNPHELGGDFVVWKSSHTPAYQLAVVVDDAAQGVSEVVRGDDLVASTPRQLLLYATLNLTPPSYTHVPLVLCPHSR